MPWTADQRKLFHELEENPEAAERHGVSQHEAGKLADEADDYAREGKERKPIKVKSFIDLTDIFTG